MMQNLISLLTLLVFLPAFAAGQEKERSTASDSEYMPLVVGNQWISERHDPTSLKKKKEIVTTRVAEMVMIDGKPVAVLKSDVAGSKANLFDTMHMSWSDKGLQRHRLGGFVVNPPILLLKSPVKAGDKWKGTFKLGGKVASYVGETVEEEVEVPAGKFKAIRATIKTESDGLEISTSKTWYVRNVGEVKAVIDSLAFDTISELKNFELKRAEK